jgi:PAS domain S-box-containing protein
MGESAALTPGKAKGSMARYAKAFKKRRTRFKAILDATSQVSMVVIDTGGFIVLFNKGAELMFGYRHREGMGRSVSSLFQFDSELAREGELLEKSLGRPMRGADVLTERARTGDFEPREWTWRHKDGHFLNVSVTVTPVVDNNGSSITQYLMVANDISALRARERNLLDKNERLCEQILAAEAANGAKSAFLATMSHEIRTPMNSILGMSGLLWESPLTVEQREYLDITRRAGNTLLKLVNDILDLSRIESGRLELEEAELNIRGIVGESMAIIGPLAREKGLALQCEIDPGIDMDLMGDPLRLQQVLINLLANAVKFTSSGEIRLSVNAVPCDAGRIAFSVSDTGLGIEAGKLESIFDNFTQADADTSRQYGGTGLGLTICRRLVSMMAGTLSVESAAGKGSTFRFEAAFRRGSGRGKSPAREVPRSRVPGQEKIAREPVRSNPEKPDTVLHRLRILIAEDSPDNRALFRAYLKRSPHDIVFAENGAEAVARYRDYACDLILMDMQMSVLDGIGATRQIRSIEKAEMRRPIPVLALSANALTHDIARSYDAGCNAHLTKPISRDRLLSAIEQYGHLEDGRAPEADGAAVESEFSRNECLDPVYGSILVDVPPGMEELVPDYVAGRKLELPIMRRLLEASDFDHMRILAHNLKGTGSSFGFTELTRMGEAMESSAKNRNESNFRQSLNELANYLDKVQIRSSAPVRETV